MLNVGVVGVGNAGGQVAALAREELGVAAIAINSSEKDLMTLPDSIIKVSISDQGRGAGKDRTLAKKFLRDYIMGIIEKEENANVFKQDVLFIISSTGGGTGSGASVMLTNLIKEIYPNTKVILVGILPTIKEALSTQLNTLEYLQELYKALDGATYMLYDNERFAKDPSTVMMQKINQAIVDDIDVLRGQYNGATRFSSIDEKDLGNIISTTGRIVVASLRDLKEKDIDEIDVEDLIINQLKTNAHCEIQRDKIVNRLGVIVNISDRIHEKFDMNLLKVQEFIGAAIEGFEHILINPDRHLPNNIFVIATGLTQVNDRIRKINDRVDEINELQKQREDDSELSVIDLEEMSSKIERKDDVTEKHEISLNSIFGKFGL